MKVLQQFHRRTNICPDTHRVFTINFNVKFSSITEDNGMSEDDSGMCAGTQRKCGLTWILRIK